MTSTLRAIATQLTPAARWNRAVRRRISRWRGAGRQAGMATAEYAIATLAACGFAALLLTLMRSAEVRALLFGIIKRALAVA